MMKKIMLLSLIAVVTSPALAQNEELVVKGGCNHCHQPAQFETSWSCKELNKKWTALYKAYCDLNGYVVQGNFESETSSDSSTQDAIYTLATGIQGHLLEVGLTVLEVQADIKESCECQQRFM